MTIPKKIKIEGHTWSIKWKDQIFDKESGEEILGECDTYNKTIFLSKKTPKKMHDLVFLHELFHAILRTHKMHYAIGITYEESIIEQLTEFMCENFSIRMRPKKTKS